MRMLRKILRSAFNFAKAKIAAQMDEINAGLQDENVSKVLLNVFALVLPIGVGLFAGVLLVRFVSTHSHLFVIGGFLAAALYSAVSKFLGVDVDDGSGADSTTVELAEQEAQEVHNELLLLVYNALAEAADYTPLQRPRDTYSIETSREKQYRMDGAMAVHQFEADYSGTLDRSKLDSLSRDIQRRIDKHARRYPLLMRDGRPPVLFDIYNSTFKARMDSDRSRAPAWLFLDELALMTMTLSRQESEAVKKMITSILVAGRALSCWAVIGVQRASSELFTGSLGAKDNFQTRILFGNATKIGADVLEFDKSAFLPVKAPGEGHILLNGIEQIPCRVAANLGDKYILNKVMDDVKRVVTR